MSGQYDIVIVDHGVMRALEKLSAGPRKRAELKGTQAAAKYLKPYVKDEAPVGTGPLSPHSNASPRGAIRKSVKRGREKGRIAYWVRPTNGKVNFIIPGSFKGVRHNRHGAARGVMPANPFVGRAADAHGDAALEIGLKAIKEALDL
jgi:hypothetical protein